MRSLELLFVSIVAGFLIAQNVRGVPRKYLVALAAAGLTTAVLSGFLGQLRWQMAPAYLVFIVLSLLLLRRSSSHIAVRSLGVVLGMALLVIAAVASIGLPVLTLPAPDGPFVVGSTSLSLVDEARDNAFFDAPDEPRELYVQVWYPGAITDAEPTPRARTLWEELHRGDVDLFTLFSSYLSGVETHSYEAIPFSPAEPAYPVIIFSHGMGSFPEQSTLLMEHLASHGYVVFATSHPYASMRVISSTGKAIYLDLDKLNEVSAAFDDEAASARARMEQAGSAEERTRLLLERYEGANGLNVLMAQWEEDLRFVLDAITLPAGRDSKLQAIVSRLDVDRIGFMGMSFGGGAVTELCKSDTRCRAALNMDGGTFGQRQRQSLRIPYLGMTRENEDFLDYLLSASRSDFYAVEVEGAKHLDFTDDAVVLPILKWLGVTGEIAAWRIIAITNAVSLRFFDAYLRGAAKPRFDDDFPELTVRTNSYVGE